MYEIALGALATAVSLFVLSATTAVADEVGGERLDPARGTDAMAQGSAPIPQSPASISSVDCASPPHRLSGFDPSASSDDLAPLTTLATDAQVVALGESVHRSGGMLGMKSRIIRTLVADHGFRVVAFETEWWPARELDRYLGSCDGSAREATRAGLRDTWHGQSMVELVQWMCEFNRRHPDDPVHFIGFNNFQPWIDVPALERFVERFAPDDAESVSGRLERCEGARAADEAAWRAGFSGTVPVDDHEACIEALDSIAAQLSAGEAELRRELSAQELTDLGLHEASLRGWELYQYHESLTPNSDGINGRDRAMARLFLTEWQSRFPGQRVVLSAHNGHVNRHSERIETVYPPPAAEGNIWEGAVRLGNYLDEELGAAYVPIGIVCFECTLEETPVAVALADLVPPTGHDVLEVRLHGLAQGDLFIDLAARDACSTGLEPSATYGFAVALDPNIVAIVEAVPSDLFSALIYLDRSPAWQPL